MKLKILLFSIISVSILFFGCTVHRKGYYPRKIAVLPLRQPISKANDTVILNTKKHETRIKIAIIDSGIEPDFELSTYLCNDEHKDFTGKGMYDTEGHGTMIAYLVAQKINPKTHCLLILKYYAASAFDSISELHAFEWAEYVGAKYINFSAGGVGFNSDEAALISRLLSKHIRIIVSGGNNSQNLSQNCNYYPACLNLNNSNFYVIGSCDTEGKYLPFSNYGGPIKRCEVGEVLVKGHKRIGTSCSTAIFTSKLIKQEADK